MKILGETASSGELLRALDMSRRAPSVRSRYEASPREALIDGLAASGVPRAVAERQLEGVEVKVLRDEPHVIHLVMPESPNRELSAEAMSVRGGGVGTSTAGTIGTLSTASSFPSSISTASTGGSVGSAGSVDV